MRTEIRTSEVDNTIPASEMKVGKRYVLAAGYLCWNKGDFVFMTINGDEVWCPREGTKATDTSLEHIRVIPVADNEVVELHAD